MMDDKQRAAMEEVNPYRIKPGCVGFPEDAFYIDVFEEGYTAAMHAHDAEIADLREKCDKLAAQLLKVNDERTEPDKLYIITGRREFKEAVQIAREVGNGS